jgi:hypothetical protein
VDRHGQGGPEASQAEVEDLDLPLGGQEQVRGLEVPVDDASPVGRLQAPAGLDGM